MMATPPVLGGASVDELDGCAGAPLLFGGEDLAFAFAAAFALETTE